MGYPVRSRPYSGWTAVVKGDNNTIGMAGATVALPNSIAAMDSNPAGFAMNLGGLAAQLNSFTLKDPEMNRGADNITEYQWGLGTSVPPWGFGISYYSPSSEHVANSEVSVRQLKISAAYLVSNRASVGLSLEYDKGIRRFDGNDFSSNHISFQVGALYKLEDHWVIGASFTPAIDIAPSHEEYGISTFGFNQTIRIPSLTSVGLGFMPNRFFKAGATLVFVGGTSDTALLYDQSLAYGQNFTLQPRIGASYILAEYNFLKIELALGTYFEVSRVQGQGNRTHGTFGLDINPYFINTGIGTDIAAKYRNWSISVGIDIVRTLRTFDIIPKDTVPAIEGTFPPIFKVNSDGLADGFTQGETKTSSPPSAEEVQKIVQDIPRRMQERFGNMKRSLLPKKKNRKRKVPEAIKALKPETHQL